MSVIIRLTYLILLGIILFQLDGKGEPVRGVRVNLLGQPCLLRGPFEEKVLKSIHLIGPDQMYMELSVTDPESSGTRLSNALKKLQTIKNLPPILDLYREHLKKRFTAQKAFFDSWKVASTEALMKPAQLYLHGEKLHSYQNALMRLLDTQGKEAGRETSSDQKDQLLEIFNEGIEPNPENEFHRSLRKLRVEYHCAFDEGPEGVE